MVIIALNALFADSIRTLSELFYWVFCCLYTFPISPAITVYFSNTFCCYLLLRSVYLFCTFVCFFRTWGVLHECYHEHLNACLVWYAYLFRTFVHFLHYLVVWHIIYFCTIWWFALFLPGTLERVLIFAIRKMWHVSGCWRQVFAVPAFVYKLKKCYFDVFQFFCCSQKLSCLYKFLVKLYTGSLLNCLNFTAQVCVACFLEHHDQSSIFLQKWWDQLALFSWVSISSRCIVKHFHIFSLQLTLKIALANRNHHHECVIVWCLVFFILVNYTIWGALR